MRFEGRLGSTLDRHHLYNKQNSRDPVRANKRLDKMDTETTDGRWRSVVDVVLENFKSRTKKHKRFHYGLTVRKGSYLVDAC